jgi:hypothetical protein
MPIANTQNVVAFALQHRSVLATLQLSTEKPKVQLDVIQIV